MPNDEPPCTRCRQRGFDCDANPSLTKLIEGSKTTSHLRLDISRMHHTLEQVCRHLHLDPPKSLLSTTTSSLRLPEDASAAQSENGRDDNACEVSPPSSPSGVPAPIDIFLEVAKLSSPGSADMTGSLTSKRPSTQHDLVGKRIISASTAEGLVSRYFNRLDHYLYGIASMYSDMTSVREASPVLFAAICTVSALHEPGPEQTLFDSCNREFRRLVSRSLFDKCNLEYMRALCIASFWLSDASRIFSSDAVRRAADSRLHRFFHHAIRDSADGEASRPHSKLTPAEVDDRVRLWYLLFVCDQHISIIHNRDSLLRNDKEITINLDAFLERERCQDSDVRILSQTSLLLIMAQAQDTTRSSQDERLPAGMQSQLNNYSRQLDRWFNKYSALFKPNPQIGDFPKKGLQLHYQFGKLHLGHYVFKGLHTDPVPTVFVPLAIMAHDAAITIFEMIHQDPQLQESLIGTPHYFHIMIAFAGHFLLEVCNKYQEQLSISLESDLGLMGNVLEIFEKMHCIPQHPIRRMTARLSQKLFRCAASLNVPVPFNTATYSANPGVAHQQNGMMATPSHMQWIDTFTSPPSDLDLMGEFAFSGFPEFQFPDMSLNFVPWKPDSQTAEPYSTT